MGEDEEGRPVANLGTEPFKVLPDALDGLKDPMVGEFDTEDETRQDPMPQVKFYLGAYESYEEMKQDLRENAFHEAQRRQRQRLAGYVWDAVEGRAPELLSVGVGETRTFFEDRVFSRFEAQWEEPDDMPLARISVLPRGGIQLD